MTKSKRAALLLTLMRDENKLRVAAGKPPFISLKQYRSKRKSDRAQGLKRPSFYDTEEWKRLRYQALKASEGRCNLCGNSAHGGATLRVDHIKSVRRYPNLRADPSNLQVLCNDCNWGKGGNDKSDWRDQDPRYGDLRLIANNGRSV
jgi:5-methylcytosine-specific restriction endonuclease McrA